MSQKVLLISFLVFVLVILFAWSPAKAPKSVTETPKSGMTETDARSIAVSTCIKGGDSLATSTGLYNENSKTWWFDANLNATKPGCNPACVVSEETKTAEINWRCTGLIVPKN